tara:strand:- start:929 stop:1321 length:393 start_codon:yes stop_codon:yes gene_type:complete
MKRLLISIALVASLSSCTVEKTITSPPNTIKTTVAPKSNTTQPRSTHTSKVQAFLVGARVVDIPLSDEEIIKTAEAVCDAAQVGASMRDIALKVAEAADGDETIMEMLSSVTVSALMFLCPEMAYLLEDL